jgi:hypothetical protein
VIAYVLTVFNRFWLVRAIIPSAFTRLIRSFLNALVAGTAGYAIGMIAINGVEGPLPRLCIGGITSVTTIVIVLLLLMPSLRSELFSMPGSLNLWAQKPIGFVDK